MRKTFYIVCLLLFTLIGYGQNIVFQPNVNHKARHLKQGLNSNGDSLILESSKERIEQVDVFNEDFLETIKIDSTKAKIDLNILPAGSFVVKARVGRKRIVMYLQKRDSPIVAYSAQEKADDILLNDEELESIPVKKKKKKTVKYYWIVKKSNSNFGSSKVMRLVYKNELENLIQKNKLEMASDTGKDNTLVIYAIYNKKKFMKKQYRNSKYYKSTKRSKHFNVVPFYSSNNEIDEVPSS